MNNRLLILTAQVISLMFSPFYMPVIAFIALFEFSYLSEYPAIYKLIIFLEVYAFTIFLPTLTIYGYRKFNGLKRHHLSQRVNRYMPYIISIIFYSTLLYLMMMTHMPHFTISIIFAALILQIVCAIINQWIKISVHSAASGGVIGALVAFSLIFQFNPIRWLCLTILLCGLVGTSRLILRQHKLIDIGIGTLVGILCGFCCIKFF